MLNKAINIRQMALNVNLLEQQLLFFSLFFFNHISNISVLEEINSGFLSANRDT